MQKTDLRREIRGKRQEVAEKVKDKPLIYSIYIDRHWPTQRIKAGLIRANPTVRTQATL